MRQSDADYFRMRAEQEEVAANRADDPAAAQIHRALAVRYLTQSLAAAEGPVSLFGRAPADGGGDEDNSRRTRQSG